MQTWMGMATIHASYKTQNRLFHTLKTSRMSTQHSTCIGCENILARRTGTLYKDGQVEVKSSSHEGLTPLTLNRASPLRYHTIGRYLTYPRYNQLPQSASFFFVVAFFEFPAKDTLDAPIALIIQQQHTRFHRFTVLPGWCSIRRP